MKFIVGRHIATAIRWNVTECICRMTWDVVEPVGVVRAVGFNHAKSKSEKAYPDLERELLRITIAD